MSLTAPMTQYKLRLAYQHPKVERLRRIAVVKPRDNDIFIGYAAQDGEFVRRLDRSIRAYGFDPWIDFDDIPNFDSSSEDASFYTSQIKSGILGADVFVLVLSQSALNCEKTLQELRLAQRLNKLIIFLCKDPSNEFDQIQSILHDLQYLDFSSSLINIVFEQVALNIIHLQTYTRLLARATEWDRQGRRQSYLLTPEDLKEVRKQKRWIETHKLGEQFQFTQLQQEFLNTVNQVHETSEYFRKSPPDIFVSYSRGNISFVEDLNQALKDARWRIWVDQDRIPVAANWRDEAEEGIRHAHTLLFIICPDSVVSKNCRWELQQARKYNKRIIPIISDSAYDRDALHEIELSSMQYVSFVRKNQSFSQSLEILLDALKENLDDLKTYRRLLLKSYEWSEHERSDGFLMSRSEYKEIQSWCKQRKNLRTHDKQELEPLLSRQKEYIQASQRYLALQRKRQGLLASSIMGVVSGLSFLLLTTTFSEIRAMVKSLEDLNGLDALVTGLRAGQRVKQHSLFVNVFRSNLRTKATTALHRTLLALREVNRFDEHDGKVFSVVFSPDSQQLVSIGDDQTIRFRTIGEPQETKQLKACKQDKQTRIGFHSASVRTITYSADQEYIATGDSAGAVKLWACNGQLHKTLSSRHQSRDPEGRVKPARVSRVQFSPGGQYLASAGTDGQLFLWTRSDDFKDLLQLEHSAKAEIIAMTFSKNGQYLASADSQGRVYLWDIKHRQKDLPDVELVDTFQYKAADGQRLVTTVSFSPDNSLLAFSGLGGVIQVHDLKQKTERFLSGHDGFVYQIVFSSDGNTLASASYDATVKLWNPRNAPGKELVHTLRGHQGPVYRLAFGPHDDLLASGGTDGIVRLWLREKGTQVDVLEGHEDEVASLAFASKASLGYSTVLASSSDDGSVRLWNIESPVQPLPHNSDVFDTSFRSDGALIASGGVENVRLWRRDGTSRSEIKFAQDSKVWAVDYSPNGKLLAAGGSNGKIMVWQPDISTKKPFQVLDAHGDPQESGISRQGVLDLSFSHDGRWLASVGTDRNLRIWRVEDNTIYRYMTVGHDNSVAAVAFSADDKLIVTGTRAGNASIKREIRLWAMPEASNNSEKNVVLKTKSDAKHLGSITSISVQPRKDGLIASGGEDGTINLWSSRGKWLRTLDEHTDSVTQVSFSSNGRFLASSSNDGTVRLWTAEGEPISVLERDNRAVSSVEFDPNNEEYLASSSASEEVLLWKLWDLPSDETRGQFQSDPILSILLTSGCKTILPFLEVKSSHTQLHTHKTKQKGVDKDYIDEIKELQKVCSDFPV